MTKKENLTTVNKLLLGAAGLFLVIGIGFVAFGYNTKIQGEQVRDEYTSIKNSYDNQGKTLMSLMSGKVVVPSKQNNQKVVKNTIAVVQVAKDKAKQLADAMSVYAPQQYANYSNGKKLDDKGLEAQKVVYTLVDTGDQVGRTPWSFYPNIEFDPVIKIDNSKQTVGVVWLIKRDNKVLAAITADYDAQKQVFTNFKRVAPEGME